MKVGAPKPRPGRVLVTGAGGFVGRPLVEALRRGGAEVHAVHRPGREPAAVPGVQVHALDLLDAAATTALVAELAPERLVHLAWYVEPGSYWSAPENLDWIAASLHLLRVFALAGGSRALITGTCAEYDWSVRGPLCEGHTPTQPHTLYGVSKDALRRVAWAFAQGQGLQLAWARLFFLYGPGEPAGRLVPALARALLAGERAPTTEGRQVRDFIHVDDVADALAALLWSSATGAVNIGTGEGVTVAEVADLIGLATGRGELIERGALAGAPGDPPRLVADVHRLREEVGFRPSIGLAEGIDATVRWWREHGRSVPPGS